MLRTTMCVAGLVLSSAAQGQLIIAHRGASYDAPENTLAAFNLAWEQNADGIEADFCLSKDGQVVCFHDKDTERVSGVKHVVVQTSYDVLSTLDVGAWKDSKFAGERIPLCTEVLATVPPNKKVFIELKMGPEIVSPLAKVLDSASLESEQIVIISFREDTIAECKKQLPRLRAHWLKGFKQRHGKFKPTAKQVVTGLRKSNADGFGGQANVDHFDQHFLNVVRDAGFNEFHVWTVDDPLVARFYQHLGLYSITTNRPAWLREQLENKPVQE